MARAIYCHGVWWLLHYLDDFLFFGALGTSEASLAASSAAGVFAGTGIPVASHKTKGPSTSVTFVVDMVQFQLRLLLEKVTQLWGLVSDWCHERSCTRKELESFIGHLAHAATVICPGWIFLWSLFDLLSLVSRPYHYVRLTAPVRADLQWWLQFLQVWNGMSFFPPSRPSHHVYSDASRSYDCGAFDVSFGWFKVRWPNHWVMSSIALKEFVPIVIATAIWGPHWQGCHVCFHSDNMAVVSELVKRAAKDACMDHLLRTLFFYVAIYKSPNLHSCADVQSGGKDLDWDALYGLPRSVHAWGLLLAPAVATA